MQIKGGGDKLLLSDGTCAIIENVKVKQLSEPETTYNFEVEDFHTYFVSDSNVLVHNMCGTPETAPDDFTKLKNGQGWRDKKWKCVEKRYATQGSLGCIK